ncbi:MAG TPA: sulfite exporter TauE/SafE family protein [Gaiellaceae bacterium]
MTFDTETIAFLVVLGVAVGALGTLVGAGGGFLLAPILLLVYPHDNPQTLTSISLAAVFANSVSGSVAYLRQRRVDIRNGLIFGACGVPGAVIGAIAVGHVPRRAFDVSMAATLGAVAIWLAANRGRRAPAQDGSVPVARGAAFSVVVGFVSSFLGIGGGVFHVPILVMALGYPTHTATATSHFVLALMSGSAVATHAVQGVYHVGHGLRRALVLATSLAVGAQLGARVSVRVPALAIERLLAVALAVVAVRLAVAI